MGRRRRWTRGRRRSEWFEDLEGVIFIFIIIIIICFFVI